MVEDNVQEKDVIVELFLAAIRAGSVKYARELLEVRIRPRPLDGNQDRFVVFEHAIVYARSRGFRKQGNVLHVIAEERSTLEAKLQEAEAASQKGASMSWQAVRGFAQSPAVTTNRGQRRCPADRGCLRLLLIARRWLLTSKWLSPASGI